MQTNRKHVPDAHSWPHLKTVSYELGGPGEISKGKETKQDWGFPGEEEILPMGVSFNS